MKESTAKQLLQSVKDSYNQIANEFSDTRNHSWNEFKYFKRFLSKDAEIIDLGCGNGRLNEFLDSYYLGQNYNYIGIDNSTGLLKNAQKKYPGKVFLPGDQIEIPVSENQADLIFNIAAFHHIPSRSLRLKALAEMNRVLKPQGKLIITVWMLFQRKYLLENFKAWLKFLVTLGKFAPNDLFIPWKNGSGKKLANRYYHSFLPGELKKLLQESGFKIIEDFSVKKGEKTEFLKSYNYCLIAEKI